MYTAEAATYDGLLIVIHKAKVEHFVLAFKENTSASQQMTHRNEQEISSLHIFEEAIIFTFHVSGVILSITLAIMAANYYKITVRPPLNDKEPEFYPD
jgi:hypothetical protein